MATTIPFEDDLLRLLFHAETVDKIAQNVTTAPATEYFVALLTGDPLSVTSQAADQTTYEVVYTGYARQAVPRTLAAWNIVNGTCSPEEIIEYPVVTGAMSPVVVTHFGIGTDLAGAGRLVASGPLLPPINISTGAEPRIDNAPLASRFPDDWI